MQPWEMLGSRVRRTKFGCCWAQAARVSWLERTAAPVLLGHLCLAELPLCPGVSQPSL